MTARAVTWIGTEGLLIIAAMGYLLCGGLALIVVARTLCRRLVLPVTHPECPLSGSGRSFRRIDPDDDEEFSVSHHDCRFDRDGEIVDARRLSI